jgi:hypothetical protein
MASVGTDADEARFHGICFEEVTLPVEWRL